jgi:hypothetical protein
MIICKFLKMYQKKNDKKIFYQGFEQKLSIISRFFEYTTHYLPPADIYPNMATSPTGVDMVPMPGITDLRASTSSIQVNDPSIATLSSSSSSSPSSPSSQNGGDDNSGKDESAASPKRGKREPVDLRSIDPQDLQVAVYNEGKSLAVYGPATRLYVGYLKALHAVFSKWLYKVSSPGWTVSIKHQEEVMTWFEKIRSGEIGVDIDAIEKYHAEKAALRAERNAKTSTISGVPTISGNGKNNKSAGRFEMQTIRWNLPRPYVDLKCTLKVGDDFGNYIVYSITEKKGSVVEAIIHPVDDEDSKSKIVPGPTGWQIWGFNRDHTIRFGG